MFESSVGQLTIVNPNNANVTHFWRGEKLNVVSSMSVNSKLQNRVTLNVVDPIRVVPQLPSIEVARLNDLYREMSNVGILVVKSKGG